MFSPTKLNKTEKTTKYVERTPFLTDKFDHLCIDKRYKLQKLLYTTNNSQIFIGKNLENDRPVVIKVFFDEIYAQRLTKIEKKLDNFKQKPKRLLKGVISFEMEKTYILVTEALGVDIKTYFSLLSKKFSFKTITLIAIQMIRILKDLHEKKLVFCNLRPKKIITGWDLTSSRLYLTDFKECFNLKSSETHENHKHFFNKYTSLNMLSGLRPEPRDDLESLAYILSYLYKGGRLFPKRPENIKKTYYFDEKLNLIPEIFLSDECCSPELISFFNYIRYLEPKSAINYSYLEGLFTNLLPKLEKSTAPLNELKYDWVVQMESENSFKKIICLSNICTGNTNLNKHLGYKRHKNIEYMYSGTYKEKIENLREELETEDLTETLYEQMKKNNKILCGLQGLRDEGTGLEEIKKQENIEENEEKWLGEDTDVTSKSDK